MRAPLAPIKAFVHDAEKLGAYDVASNDDARLSHWFSVAQAAERLATLAPHERPEYLKVLCEAVLPERAERPTQIEGDGRAPTDVLGQLAERLRLEAEDMERASCFELALTTVSAVCQLLAKHAASGRLLATAQLGRVNRQMGDLDSAVDCYRTVTEDAAALGDGPVGAHGFIGLGNVAHIRGNRPAQKLFFDEALKLAAHGSIAELSAHQGLLIVAIAHGHLGDALLHGWRAHDLAPPNSEAQMEIVNNLSNVAREAGFLTAALAGHEFVIQRATLLRLRLPAIGGAIRAAARLGDKPTVKRLERLGRNAIDFNEQPYEISRFLLWVAEAWYTLDEHVRVLPLLDESVLLAERFGFHEITIRADQLRSKEVSTSRRATPDTPTAWSVNAAVALGIGRLHALSHA